MIPDEITQVVKLPPHLKEHPFLQEFYGTVEWSSKAIFNQYMGWFSGSATELHPLPPKVSYHITKKNQPLRIKNIIIFKRLKNNFEILPSLGSCKRAR